MAILYLNKEYQIYNYLYKLFCLIFFLSLYFRCESKGCNVRFRAIDNLEYHRKCHTSGKTFQCPECRMDFGSWGAIAGHLWRNHNNDMELHGCDQCPFR